MTGRWPFIGRDFHLDTNRVNARGRLPAVTELEDWAARGVIGLAWSAPVYEELKVDAPDGPLWQKAMGRLVVHPHPETEGEQSELDAIEKCVFPGGARTENERVDALALFSAKKYIATFVTADGITGRPRKILSARHELAELGVKVVTDDEAVEVVRERVALFADNERCLAEREGRPPASWVGEWSRLYDCTG